MTSGQAVEFFDPRKSRQFVNNARCYQNLGGEAGRAVGTFKLEAVIDRADVSDLRLDD